MPHIIATANMKGGVGKTTLTVNLAACLARNHQQRVLVVDLDTQISATLSLMSPADFAKRRKEKRTLRHLVNQILYPDKYLTRSPSEVIRPSNPDAPNTANAIAGYLGNVKGLDLLPGDIELYDEFMVSKMLHEQTNARGEEGRFEATWNHFEQRLIYSILEPVFNDYDFIILDCAPGYSLLTRSGLLASDFYMLPARPEPLSVIGIQLLQRRIERLRTTHEADKIRQMQLLGIVFTMSGNLLTGRYYRQVVNRVRQDFSGQQLFSVHIPSDVRVAKSVDRYLPVVLTDPEANASKALAKLTREFLSKLKTAQGSKAQESKLSLSELE
ncbi:ParA family protein [Sphaerothrix gracilis]|uniref:ParA family protein n=1 Tax=Sphaerothrix gracilis TaxID=3151835 RepID=UPI0031FDC545